MLYIMLKTLVFRKYKILSWDISILGINSQNIYHRWEICTW